MGNSKVFLLILEVRRSIMPAITISIQYHITARETGRKRIKICKDKEGTIKLAVTCLYAENSKGTTDFITVKINK